MAVLRPIYTAAVVLGLCGCGSDCLALAHQYADEKDNALACDPGSAADQCGDSLPVVDYLVNGQQMSLDGLGSCLHSFNPARDGKLKQILSEYKAAGCRILDLPLCPGVFDRCYVNELGKGVCFQ